MLSATLPTSDVISATIVEQTRSFILKENFHQLTKRFSSKIGAIFQSDAIAKTKATIYSTDDIRLLIYNAPIVDDNTVH